MIYTFSQLQSCANNKAYITNGFLNFKTLRYPVVNDQVHFIRNHQKRNWEPIAEKAFQDFILFKHVNVINLDPLKILFNYKTNG
jgi:hypothetical protein